MQMGGIRLTKQRREAIRALLQTKPFVGYDELGAMFPDVSEMTLRRDIDLFEREGDAIKVRGGARSTKFITVSTDDSMSARMHENMDSKARIALEAALFLDVGRSIFLDSGSTVQQMASAVPQERFTFTVTNPALALELVKNAPQCAVNIVGGRLDRDYQSVSGLQAMRYLADVNIDIAFLSPSGLSVRSGFTGGNYAECELKRYVAEKAATVVMLMDSSKIERSLPYTFCNFDSVDLFITDRPLPPDLAAQAKENGVRVICTDGG